MKRTASNICPVCDAGDPCSVVTSCECQDAGQPVAVPLPNPEEMRPWFPLRPVDLLGDRNDRDSYVRFTA